MGTLLKLIAETWWPAIGLVACAWICALVQLVS